MSGNGESGKDVIVKKLSVADEKALERAAHSFRAAAKGGFAPLVRMLIIKNRNKYPDHFVEKILNSRDNDGATPLFLAASIGATDTVEVLLGQPGINVNKKNDKDVTPLRAALGGDHAEPAELLLEYQKVFKKDDVKELGIALGHYKADPVFDVAKFVGSEELLTVLKDKDENVTVEVDGSKFFHQNWNPLCHAAGLGFVHVVNQLLRRDNITGKGKTTITEAEKDDKGKGKNKKSAERKKGERELDLGDGEGLTALYLAASGGHVRVVKSLIKAGADINCLSKGNLTPLYGASKQGHARIVEILLGEKGIHLDIRSDEGDNALDIAVTGGFDAVADLLMEYVPPEDEEKVDEKDQENEK